MQKTQKKPKAMEVILSQIINLGGELMTREAAYASLKAEGQSERCASFFAFGTPCETPQKNGASEE